MLSTETFGYILGVNVYMYDNWEIHQRDGVEWNLSANQNANSKMKKTRTKSVSNTLKSPSPPSSYITGQEMNISSKLHYPQVREYSNDLKPFNATLFTDCNPGITFKPIEIKF